MLKAYEENLAFKSGTMFNEVPENIIVISEYLEFKIEICPNVSMHETNQSVIKSDTSHKKYLLINSATVLDGTATSRINKEDDLIIQTAEEGISHIFKDGKSIVEYFNKLTNQHGYSIALYSTRKESQIIGALESFNKACRQQDLNEFPKIHAMVVKDHKTFPQVKASDLQVAQERYHGILTAGYSSQFEEETSILTGLSNLLNISKLEHDNYLVLDNRPSFIKEATKKGWNVHAYSLNSLKELLAQFYQKVNEPQIKGMRFKLLEKGPSVRGSSISIERYIDEESNTEWVGKCSTLSLIRNDGFFESKELLASRVYGFFGVHVPETLLIKKRLTYKEIQDLSFLPLEDIDVPKLRFMSKVVPDLVLLGEQFIKQYKLMSKQNKKKRFCFSKGGPPLKGFGRVMAVAVLIHDYDFVGKNGRNIGYIPKDNGKYYEIVKIDPGEALMPDECLTGARSLRNPLEKRGAVLSASGARIRYDELNEFDQKEFVETLKEILQVKLSKLEEIFLPHFQTDPKFQGSYEELLSRRKQFLAVFSPEVEHILSGDIRSLEEQQAQKHMTSWGQSPILLYRESKQKEELIRNKVQLEAFALEDSTNPVSAVFQASIEKERFVGRDFELQKIENAFSSGTGITACTIVGGPGLGKKQLVAEFIFKNHQKKYSQVFWIHAEQGDLISDQIQIFLETCYNIRIKFQKKVTLAKMFYQILTNETCNQDQPTKKPCIVFENAVSVSQLADYLPNQSDFPSLKIDILITSRYTKWGKFTQNIIELHAFEPEDTKNYVKKCFPQPEPLSKEAERFHNLLEGLPLAISRAVIYIKRKGITISDFCNLLDKESYQELFCFQAHDSFDNDEEEEQDQGELRIFNSVSTSLTLALVNLRSKNSILESILDILAFLFPKGINKITLQEVWKQCNKTRSIEEFEKAFKLMVLYCIVTFDPFDQIRDQLEIKSASSSTSMVKVHPFLQRVIRLNHRRSGIYETRHRKVLSCVISQLDYNERDVNDALRANLFVQHGIHLESLRSLPIELKRNELFTKIGALQLYGVGNFAMAKEYYKKALQFTKSKHGTNHPEIGTILIDLGNAYGSLGKHKKQKVLLCKALRILKKLSPADDLGIGNALGSLSNACAALGEYKAQKDFLTKALIIFQKHYGKEHLQVANTLCNLGNAWGALGNYKKQESLLISALVMKEKFYGENHPKIAETLINLSNSYEGLKDFESQKNSLSRAREIFERNYGKSHPQIGITLIQLAHVYGAFNSRQQRDLLSQALKILENCCQQVHHHPQDNVSLGSIWIAVRALKTGEQLKGEDQEDTNISLKSPREALIHLYTSIKQKIQLLQALEFKHNPQNVSTGESGGSNQAEEIKEQVHLAFQIEPYNMNFGISNVITQSPNSRRIDGDEIINHSRSTPGDRVQ